MKTTFRVTFYNYDLTQNALKRTENLLKELYWKKGEEPENWDDFDGDIEVVGQQSRGGDCALILVSSDWRKSAYDFLKKNREIRSIEVVYNDSSKDLIKEIDDKRRYTPNAPYFVGDFVDL